MQLVAKDKLGLYERCRARLEQVNAKLFITDSDPLVLSEVASELARVIPILELENNTEGWPTLEGLVQAESADARVSHAKTAQEAGEHNAFINRTSGSSGKMKSLNEVTTSPLLLLLEWMDMDGRGPEMGGRD
ncbi:uncharacterized protein N7482_003191 [Penicillium canariense]|uniref:Uncharacterized protein n=1 Tax=Penicillium canariense TaxID=189055 RepID=A0A9W9I9W5_9EURO|nr:uncharacterized protein N7482_003191 [Penicillium canariense]KAJ5167597.1 hypothetical protein N7482_003191 [Penicillium canariense]